MELNAQVYLMGQVMNALISNPLALSKAKDLALKHDIPLTDIVANLADGYTQSALTKLNKEKEN